MESKPASADAGNTVGRFKRFLFPLAIVLPGVLFGCALYFGWIGQRSMDWQEFRHAYALNEFQELRFGADKITAFYRDKPNAKPLVIYPPSKPLPELDQRWFVVKALKHNIRITFEETGEAYNTDTRPATTHETTK